MLFYTKHKRAILLFHRISLSRDPLWDPIDPVLFARTLKFVAKKFHIISLNEMLFSNVKSTTKPLAALTFDDGYRDFIDHAIPILDKEKVKASMFVVSDCIDKKLPTWTYIVDFLFNHSKKMEWKNYDLSELPEEYKKTKWNSREERIQYCRKFKQYLKWISSIKRDSMIDSLVVNFDDIQLPDNMMMTWDEIRQVNNAGFQIGSHSVTHPTLATIADEQLIEYELKHSAIRIREKTGIESDIFSYPIGSYDDRVKRLTKEAGYKAALAVNKKMYDQNLHDLFEIPRIELYSESWLKTRMRIDGIESFIIQFIKK